MKLTGSSLKDKVDSLIKQGVGMSACCIETGYYSLSPTGNKIPSTNQFSRALLSALGYEFSSSGKGVLRDNVSVMGNGTVMLSPGRCKAAGILPGDECDIVWNETDHSFVIRKKRS